MGFFKESTSDSNFVRHEIKTYQRKGDQVRSEYERLNPDGTVTKSVAYGDCKEGLRYRTFQMDTDGTVREVAPEHSSPKAQVSSQPPQQQQVQQQQQPQRKAFAFVVEPKNYNDEQARGVCPGLDKLGWTVRPLNVQEKEKPVEPAQKPAVPWWYDTLKDAVNDGIKKEEKEKVYEKPQVEERKPSTKRLFSFFDDDFFFKPLKIRRPKFDPFDIMKDSFFDIPRLGFSHSLLEDF